MSASLDAAVGDLVSAKLDRALPQMIGKTISAIAISRGPNYPVDKWHLVFSDGTSYELFSEAPIQGSSTLDDDTVEELRAWARRDRRALKVVASER